MPIKTLSNFFLRKQRLDLEAIKGVFIPNVLQMIGVILFMRLGWIVGHIGIFNMSVIIGMSSILLLITSFSMSSIVSNMRVGGGGAYYIISRMLGAEFGSAIGILLCLAQCVSTALCVTGFALSLQEFLPQIPIQIVEFSGLCVLLLISYISTEFVLKTQILIFIALVAAIFSVFFSSDLQHAKELPILDNGIPMTFWIAFAMFFPATTGIETGMSLSGDLKNPSRNLPIGTITSVLFAFLLYLSLAYFLSSAASPEVLRSYPFLVFHLSKMKPLIMLGIWGATLSSALGGLMGAPRVLQALAKDGVLPSFLGKGSGKTDQPKIAGLFVFIIVLALTLFTNINQIIPILTMIALLCYGLINFVAFFEGFIQNPSFRPSLRTPWSISLIGSLGCFIVMLMIHPGATLIVLLLTGLLYFWISDRNLNGNWDDLRHSLLAFLVNRGAAKLNQIQPNPKSWRPHILTIFDDHTALKNLAFFSYALDQEKGFLTFATCLNSNNISLKQQYERTFSKYQISHYLHVNNSENSLEHIEQIIKNYGMGSLKPNTVVLPLQQNFVSSPFFGQFLNDISHSGKNILFCRCDPHEARCYSENSISPKKIHLWWRGGNQKNFELTLALSYTLRGSPIWSNSVICIKSIVTDEEEEKKLRAVFSRYQSKLRIRDFDFEPIIDPEKKFFGSLAKYSDHADFVFLGLRPIGPEETIEEYKSYFDAFMKKTECLKNCCFVLSDENLKFEKIFV